MVASIDRGALYIYVLGPPPGPTFWLDNSKNSKMARTIVLDFWKFQKFQNSENCKWKHKSAAGVLYRMDFQKCPILGLGFWGLINIV